MVYSADVGGSTGACVVAARLIDTRHDSNISLADRSAARPFRCAGGVGLSLIHI